MTGDTGRNEAGVDTRDDDDDDNEALTWGVSSDKSYVEGPATAMPAATDGDEEEDDDDDGLPPGVMSSAMLVVHGVFGGIYLLFTVAWLISVSRAEAPSLAGVPLLMWHVGQWLAVLAPALWFAGTMAFTPITPSRRRLLWFIVGVLVLIPWPWIAGGVS